MTSPAWRASRCARVLSLSNAEAWCARARKNVSVTQSSCQQSERDCACRRGGVANSFEKIHVPGVARGLLNPAAQVTNERYYSHPPCGCHRVCVCGGRWCFCAFWRVGGSERPAGNPGLRAGRRADGHAPDDDHLRGSDALRAREGPSSGVVSRDYAAAAATNFVSIPARLSMPSKPGLSTGFRVGLLRRDELLGDQRHQRVVQRDHACRLADLHDRGDLERLRLSNQVAHGRGHDQHFKRRDAAAADLLAQRLCDHRAQRLRQHRPDLRLPVRRETDR